MMKVKILRDCAVKGQHLSAGDSAELDDLEARDLLDMGKAVRMESNRAIGAKKSDGKLKTRK
jgi:hypothetical protein